jgi:hypothetical protein
MLQGISGSDRLQLIVRKPAERTARTGEQNLLNLVAVLADKALEDGTVLAVNRQDRRMILLCQLKNQLAGNDKCLLVGKADSLLRLDGMDGRSKTGIAHHRRQHHVNGRGFDDLFQCLAATIHLYIGHIGQFFYQRFIESLVGNGHGGGMETACLSSKLFPTAVGRECISLIKVGVLADYIQCLRTDAAR